MIYPIVGIFIPSSLETLVVLGGFKGNTCFYEEDRIRYIAFNFYTISDKILLDLFYISPIFFRNTRSPNFTSI
jgi:hypothetical protein